MRLVDATEPTFARHETFHPRYGWFRKAYTHAADDPHVFTRDDAPVLLGVGKNMVRAIRFWGLAAKLIVQDPQSSNPRKPGLVPTRFGHSLFGEEGWDRYMEDPGTLWLLHWLLLAPPSKLPVWWLAFNEFHPVEFSDDELEAAITTDLEAVSDWANPHPSSIKKDVSALVRTYAPAQRSGRLGIDDLLDCPLRELNLIGRSASAGRFRFILGVKPTLPAAIVGYAVLDYVSRTVIGGNSIPTSRLSNEPGSPGQAFRMTEAELIAAVEATIANNKSLSLTDPTGATQLSWSEPPSQIATDILNDYYDTIVVDSATVGPDGDLPSRIHSATGPSSRAS